MKLYRGIKAEEFELLSKKSWQESRKIWLTILQHRDAGDFRYPKDLDVQIKDLARIARLELQYFTDNKKVAQRYAKVNKGLVIELDVAPATIAKFFRLEFQNFSNRRKKFEIVYAVESKVLRRQAKAWQLTIHRL